MSAPTATNELMSSLLLVDISNVALQKMIEKQSCVYRSTTKPHEMRFYTTKTRIEQCLCHSTNCAGNAKYRGKSRKTQILDSPIKKNSEQAA